MISCFCIDDSNRPKQIPIEKWVKKDEKYTIIWVYNILNGKQKGIKGCDLAEITLDESCAPYEVFKLSRFAIYQKDLEALIQLMIDCSQGEEVIEHIKQVIKESELVIIED